MGCSASPLPVIQASMGDPPHHPAARKLGMKTSGSESTISSPLASDAPIKLSVSELTTPSSPVLKGSTIDCSVAPIDLGLPISIADASEPAPKWWLPRCDPTLKNVCRRFCTIDAHHSNPASENYICAASHCPKTTDLWSSALHSAPWSESVDMSKTTSLHNEAHSCQEQCPLLAPRTCSEVSRDEQRAKLGENLEQLHKSLNHEHLQCAAINSFVFQPGHHMPPIDGPNQMLVIQCHFNDW